ncbi:ookinete surface protein, putative [Hepatocystis sp. ex Piliocolobus tephrosceles]|nr:ookinete surface protein, putative [Hepatocystis sp. ex Piliocolobus tephrosceles]
MKTSYIVFFFVCIQLALSFNNAALTDKSECTNGFLVQMADTFECRCNENFIPISEDKCEVKVECSDKDVKDGDYCGPYAKCVKKDTNGQLKLIRTVRKGKDIKKANVDVVDVVDVVNVEYECKCIDKYEKKDDVCILSACKDKNCEKGKCITNDENQSVPICACNANHILKDDKCEKDNVDTVCTLPCKDKSKCKLNDTEEYLFCECNDPSCTVSAASKNIISILGVLSLIVLSMTI